MVVTKLPDHLSEMPATMDRNAQNGMQQRRGAIARRAKAAHAVEFFNVLMSPALLETTESELPEHRERLYPPGGTIRPQTIPTCRTG